MILTDVLMLAALAVFAVVWFIRAIPARPLILLAAALVALGAGIAGVLDDRWQAGLGVCVAVILLIVLGVNRLRKADAKSGVPFLSGLAFVLLSAVAAGAIYMFPINPLPKPSGEYAVGIRTFDVVDESRRGVMNAGADAPRRLLVRVWYPAQSTAGHTAHPYLTEREAETTARSLGQLTGFPPFFTYTKHVRTNSYDDAPLLEGAHDLPVVFYSHGYTSFLGQNTALMEHLASHGYIVFSLQHAGDSSYTVFADGSEQDMDPALLDMASSGDFTSDAQKDVMAGDTLDKRLNGRITMAQEAVHNDSRLLRSGRIWVADRIFLHDQLQRGRVPENIREIAAAGNLARTGEMGMSFGGAASGALCYIDPRCGAAINLDGGDFLGIPFNANIPVPFMMFHSDMRNVYRAQGVEPPEHPRGYNEFSYETIANAGARDDVIRVQLKDIQHLGLSDFTRFMRTPLRTPIFGSTPTDVTIGAQNDFTLGFFDRYLRGEANDFPARQRAAYADWIAPVDNSDIRAWWAAKSEAERAEIEARITAAKAPIVLVPTPAAAPAAVPATP